MHNLADLITPRRRQSCGGLTLPLIQQFAPATDILPNLQQFVVTWGL